MPEQPAPFFSLDEQGRPSGFAVSLIEQVAPRAGIQYQYQLGESERRAVEAVQSGKAHVLPLARVSPSEPGGLIYTDPVITIPLSVFIRAHQTGIETIDDLSGAKLGMVAGEIDEPVLENIIQNIRYETFADADAALLGLISGRVQVLIRPSSLLWKQVADYGLDDTVRELEISLGDVSYAFAVAESLPDLRDRLNDGLQAFMISGDYRDLREKWFERPATRWHMQGAAVFWVMSFVLLSTIVLMTYLKHRALSRQNESLQSQIDAATAQLSEDNRYLEDLTITDTLTRVGNRRAFETGLRELLERAQRYHEGFSMLIFDIDDFKRVNDLFGHDAGDRALTELVERLCAIVRNVDILSRWGGEEFTILMPNTGQEGAVQMAERCRHALGDEDFDIVGRVTVSVGATEYRDGDDAHQFFQRADDALYRAKSRGKNCVVWNG